MECAGLKGNGVRWQQLLTFVHKRVIISTTIWHETLLNIACGVNIVEQFREKVKQLRKKMGWAQEDLARQIDVSLSTVQRWESIGAKPTRLARKELRRLLQEAGIDDGWDVEH